MKAFNVVRFRVKPGGEQQFIEAHSKTRRPFAGFIGGNLIRTGDRTFCLIGEWRSMKSLAKARPEMIAFLDTTRHLLEDLGTDLGVTDPVSGEVAAKLRPARKPAKKKAAVRSTRKKAIKASAKKKATRAARRSPARRKAKRPASKRTR